MFVLPALLGYDIFLPLTLRESSQRIKAMEKVGFGRWCVTFPFRPRLIKKRCIVHTHPSSFNFRRYTMKFAKNMGTLDRVLRIIVAIIFGYLYFSGTVSGAFGIILLVLGIVFLLTSFVSFCPLYLPFKISTLKK